MAILKVLVAPNPTLAKKSVEVTEVTAEIKQQLDDMLETMYKAPGIGLAANQVGILKRMIVVDIANPEDEEPQPYKMINPVITHLSEDMDTYDEGCLSVPTFYEEVERPAACIVEYMDENGQQKTLEADHLLSTCIQHEIDHLDGILFVDHLSRLKKNMIIKKLTKLKKSGAFDKEIAELQALSI
ncbi:MAG: peptide deformylase [Alphaproteobacteria bacterium]|jgi:peptide deformylase